MDNYSLCQCYHHSRTDQSCCFFRLAEGVSRGVITEIVESLLHRCVHETDPEARVLLATCFGEVGAVGAHRLEEIQPSHVGPIDTLQKSCKAPWFFSLYEYELKLISNHLVVALKSAQTASDQHKIAFTIQQLLALLNEAAKKGLLSGPLSGEETRLSQNANNEYSNDRSGDLGTKPQMKQALLVKLGDAGVLDIVEPFWFSEFHEVRFSVFRCFWNFFVLGLTPSVGIVVCRPKTIHRVNLPFSGALSPSTAGFLLGVVTWYTGLT